MTHRIHIQRHWMELLQPSSFNGLGIDFIHCKSITLVLEKCSLLRDAVTLSQLFLLAPNVLLSAVKAAPSTDVRCECPAGCRATGEPRFMETSSSGWSVWFQPPLQTHLT